MESKSHPTVVVPADQVADDGLNIFGSGPLPVGERLQTTTDSENREAEDAG